MPELNVSRYVMPGIRSGDQGLIELVDWLNDNIGEWDKCVYSRTGGIVREGVGWVINTRKTKDNTPGGIGFNVISWYINIEDERLATLFALRWIK